MFEWHGWATIRTTPAVAEYQDLATDATVIAVTQLVDETEGVFDETVDLRWANGDLHLWLAGCHNRPPLELLSFYEAVAETAPGSYGVLYTLDHDTGDIWSRYVMARGKVEHEDDESLSPHVGRVEDAF
jgi:hypothetical protein